MTLHSNHRYGSYEVGLYLHDFFLSMSKVETGVTIEPIQLLLGYCDVSDIQSMYEQMSVRQIWLRCKPM